ncbi:MAG: T9SS type A sorting domain-containing protein [Dysgonamonadaceae bacterium]|jgi:PKD repeat protein|nr:T9SS type A sorting domain-containing protein [Dysgonamonadaceae bacterium]
MNTKLLIILSIAWTALTVSAQRQNETLQFPPAHQLSIPFEVQKLLSEDAEMEKLGFPHRIAQIIPVALNTENSGEWAELPDGGRVWRMELAAPGATAVSLLYDRFVIPEHGKFFISSSDGSEKHTYTNADNPKRAEYSTEYVYGDKIRLEYVESISGESPNIQISGLAYAYKDVVSSIEMELKKTKRIPGGKDGDSEYCEININCPEGDSWQDQKKSVAVYLIVLGEGQYSCSGALVNNELQDLTPYFLTAYHCGGSATEAELNQWRFYFHYERTGCDEGSPLAEYKMLTGASKLVYLPDIGESDGLLLKLNETVPREWDVYYSGWDRRNQAIAGGATIHHPKTDVKKISTYTREPGSMTINFGDGIGAQNAHWELVFDKGICEPGSSGAPLFNAEHRITGTLTGGIGLLSCGTLSTLPCFFGKLSWHWDQSLNPKQRMNLYLDPNGTGIEFIDGTYGNDTKVAFLPEARDIYAAGRISFSNRSRGDIDTWIWEFPGGTPNNFNGKNPPVIEYNAPGNFTAKLTAKKGTEIAGTYEVPVNVTIKQNYCQGTPVNIGNGTETSPYPLGIGNGIASSKQTRSIALYTAQELGIDAGSFITDLEWNANKAVSHARTLYVYLQETDEQQLTQSTWGNEEKAATLVYQSSQEWTNTVGANKITLTEPFPYSGKNLKVLVSAYSNTSSSENAECPYTIVENNMHQRWTNILAAYGTLEKNRPNIRFYHKQSCPPAQPVADFKVSNTNIFEEDTVEFTDCSTGPSVIRTWTLTGGTPEISQLEKPRIIYRDAGVYDVSLWVKNTEGENEKEQKGFITVTARKPVVQFTSASKGFIKKNDGGQLLPLSGGSVQFAHQSINKPRSITWTFNGLNTASNDDEPVVIYPAGENKYDVNLLASNSGGTDELLKTEYVQVGGIADVWNMQPEETADKMLAPQGTVLNSVGSNYTRLSERFIASEKGFIIKVRVYTCNVDQSNQGEMTLAVYSNKNGLPDKAISTTLKTVEINPDGYTTFTFPEPMEVSDTFHIVVGTSSYLNMAYSVPAAANRKITQHNTASSFERFSSRWISWREQKIFSSLNIVPEFSFTEPTGMTDISKSDGLKIYPNPAEQTFYVESSLDENILTDAQIKLYTIDGVLIRQQKATGKRTLLTVYQPGVYLIRLNGERGIVVVR